MTNMGIDVKSAVAEIASTTDLLGRMADAAERKVIRMTWNEWRASRAALAEKGLSAPSRRTTARPEARAALRALEDDFARIHS